MSLLKTVSIQEQKNISAGENYERPFAQYESERRAYAKALIDFDKTWSKLFTGKPRTEENQDGITHEQFLKYVPSRIGYLMCTGFPFAF